ncbi:MAG: transglutaminase domain-containing protein [Proteobacteria bacterium]|nr:transglutaminase domain-containing protein [Pseudomonadota bacterium]
MSRKIVAALIAVVCIAMPDYIQAAKAKNRTFQMSYTVKVKGIPSDAKDVDVWLPYPTNDEAQEILEMNVKSPYPTKVNYDKEFGNGILYVKPMPGAEDFEVKMTFKVKRDEIRNKKLKNSSANLGDMGPYYRYLTPSKYAVINDTLKKFAAQATKGKRGNVAKAKGAYDFILDKMAYNKSIPGWGKGDVNRLCLTISGGKEGTGNCTDFHSFFGSIMRTQGIPVVFEMGFPLKPGKDQVAPKKGGYHCWAKFYVPGKGWVPVDISEADKDPKKTDYFFGSICENRVKFSRGRDILLEPNQRGGRLNYFGPDPYIEVDGVSFNGFERTIAYKDI